MRKEIEKEIERINIEVDNYNTTLNVLKLFGHEMCCAPGSIDPKDGCICWCGRRMTTSTGKQITPDLVIRLTNFGTLAEVKNSLPKNVDYWQQPINQLISYDDNLSGWSTENNEKIDHDVVLLVPDNLRVFVKDYFTEKVNNGEIDFERNFAVISFHREDKAKTFYSFCRFFGNISDADKDEELRTIALVPADTILPKYNYFFCDEKPPLPYTMSNVWSQMGEYIDHDSLIEKGDFNISFVADKLLCDIKSANSPVIINLLDDDCNIEDDPRNPSYPKAEWIREALDKLRHLDYLNLNKKNPGIFNFFKKV